MPDLILNINFIESRKKNKIVIETYEGTIPKLKSKQYSGQLRNVNINSLSKADNISEVEFKQVLDFLNNTLNTQINKNQYLISNSCLIGLETIASFACLFYKAEKKGPMFQVDNINYNSTSMPVKHGKIEGVIFGGEQTQLFFDIDDTIERNIINQVEVKVYINLSVKSFPMEVVFDYDNFNVNYLSEDRVIASSGRYRDFGFEQRAKENIEKCNWKYKKDEGFQYIGKSLGEDIDRLRLYGINIYTNSKQRITTGDFSDIHISYNIDWFEITGNVKFDEESVDISEIIDLKKKRENWVEYNGKIIILSDAFKSKAIKIEPETNKLKIDKEDITDALLFSHGINGKDIEKIEDYLGYENIEINIDSGIGRYLRSYQMVGVKWLLSLKHNGFGGCLADDMGLGKTIQIIAFLSDTQLNKGCSLIVVPKTLLLNWQREIEKFSPDTSYYIYHGVNRSPIGLNNYRIILSTYGTVLNDFKLLEEYTFDNVIIDEAQYIKNSKSKAYRALYKLKADSKYILTGTPVENNIKEYWGLMRFINSEIMTSYTAISKDVQGQSLVEKIKLITSPFVLRRMKNDVLSELPQKQEQVLYCQMELEQSNLYRKMLNSIRYELQRKNDRFEIKNNSIMLNGLLYLQQICCHPLLLNKELNEENCLKSAKLELLLELLGNLYETGHKVVVFSRFTKMLKIIEKKVIAQHFNYYYLDGKTQNRMQLVDEFERCEQGVFLISLKAGGTGINLVSADTAIIYDPWWNPAVEKQAEDRIYRIGQKNNVMIYRLITADTIEEKIQKLQKEKLSLYSQMLDGLDMPTSMTAEIMERLILE